MLASLAEAVRVISILLSPYMPQSTGKLLDALVGARHATGGGRVRSPRRRSARRHRAPAALSEALIDSHTHLHLCEPPTAELVAAAAEAGVSRMVTVGTDGASCRAALAAAEDFPQVYAAIGRHPNSATGFDDADLAELEALAAHEKCVAIGETGLDYYRDGGAGGRSEAGLRGPDRARSGDRQAAGHPHARRRRRHARDPRRRRRRRSA